jgi:CheY-like chemotaxis protein
MSSGLAPVDTRRQQQWLIGAGTKGRSERLNTRGLAASTHGSTTCVRDTEGMASEVKELRCIIVDDNPAFIEVATRLLERGGISIIGAASTIAEAVQRVEELRPDVTLVDVDLGGESGFHLAVELHRPDSNGGLKIILTSAHSEHDFADMIAASPAVGFLPKADLSSDAIHELLATS